MANIVEDIFDILYECCPREDNEEEATSIIIEDDDLDKIISEVEKMLAAKSRKMGSIEYANLNKMLAISYFKKRDEINGICRLIESHAVILRQQILHRYVKTGMHKTFLNTGQSYGLRPVCGNLGEGGICSPDTLTTILSELPEEWYMIQITAKYESPSKFSNTKLMHPIHITVLPTGNQNAVPLCVTLPKPGTGSYDVCNAIQELMSSNRDELEATYANKELYWKMRKRQNTKLKETINELEYEWLREWRILFMADLIDNNELVKDLKQLVHKLIADSKVSHEISDRSKWLLEKIVLSACFLSRDELAHAIKYTIPKHDKLAGNLVLSIQGKLSQLDVLKTAKRKTLVLIVDEHMDYIPFESMDILSGHPATRFPSLHVAYTLFKEHESTIENGCKIIKAKHDMGTCIVNPSGNLAKMEKRMRLFMEYWLPQWRNWYSVKPEAELFEDALVNNDILMYNGHGSGIQYLAGERIERLRVKSIVLLFGCCSVKLLTVGGRYPPYGVSNQYLIAASPSVLGMLWEVTDADIDKMTANFISNWIPSTSKRPWSDVDLNAWCTGTLKFTKNEEEGTTNVSMEPEMLRAVTKSKDACCHFMTAAAIVVRGLPVKLI